MARPEQARGQQADPQTRKVVEADGQVVVEVPVKDDGRVEGGGVLHDGLVGLL
jgi:hypothetical protein